MLTKIHGGFKVGDKVEIKSKRGWIKGYVIADFKLMQTQVYHESEEAIKYYPAIKIWISIFEVRHPQFAKGKV